MYKTKVGLSEEGLIVQHFKFHSKCFSMSSSSTITANKVLVLYVSNDMKK